MATTTDKTSKKSKKTTAKPKETKQKQERAPKEPKPDLVVFAFRLPVDQRDQIHSAAGPGKATRFVLAAALAAASGDQKAFDTLVESRATKK